jgi:hypothetical protein
MNCQVRVTAGDRKNPVIQTTDFDKEAVAVAFMAALATHPEVLMLEFIANDAVQFDVILHAV